MDRFDETREKMAELKDKIEAVKHRLELKGLFSKDQQSTASELMERHRLLQNQLAEELADLEAHGHHVSALEKSVLSWINSLNFDHKS